MNCSNLVIQKGCTFRKVVRWETPDFAVAAISAITQAGIVRVTTAAPHGIPDGWRAAVVGVKGMTELNAANNPPRGADFRVATVISPSSIEFNKVSSAAFPPYRSGGYLKWLAPHDLAGYTARMDLVDPAGLVLTTLTTENGKIVIDNAEKVIELVLSAAVTGALTFASATFALEMISPTSEVTAILTGAVTVADVA